MIYKKKKAYVLAIHGMKYWAAIGLGNGTDMFIEDYFTDHYGDGGTALNTLESVPTFQEIVDATGGFGRLSDASFTIVDTRDNVYAKFFAASKTANSFSSITEDLNYTDTSITVISTSLFADNDILCLPRETIKVDAVDTETEMAVSRSIYPAFIEGRWSTYNAVHPKLGIGCDIVKGGHWNHSGRWVCVYETETDATGTFCTPYRVYAGIITEVGFDGKKVILNTKSITSMMSDPMILGVEHRLDTQYTNNVTDFRLRLVNSNQGDMSRIDSTYTSDTYTDISALVEMDLNYRALNQYSSGLKYEVSPGLINVIDDGTAPTAATCPNPTFSHPAFTKLYAITDSATTTATGMTTSSGTVPNYDTIILPGWKFKFDKTMVYPKGVASQFFLFDSGYGDKIICKCTYDTGTEEWTVDDDSATPWFSEDGTGITYYVNGFEARWLCINKAECIVRTVLIPSQSLAHDLLISIYQIAASTGESINPNEDGSYTWWQSYGFPYYLLDYDTFAPIYYNVRPVVYEAKSLVDIYEQSLKIAGYRVVWSFSSGKLVAKKNILPYPNYANIEYGYASVTTDKPSTQIGYQAPLSSVSIEWKKVVYVGQEKPGKKYSFSMADSLSQYNAGVNLALQDEHAIDEYPGFETVAYSNILWLSATVPSSIIRVSTPSGDVGDVVLVSHKYVADADGYGVVERAGVQTEISVGPSPTVRVLFSGNTVTNMYGVLAPAAMVDQTVGTRGYDSGSIYFVDDIFEDGRNWCKYVQDETGLSVVNVMCKTRTETLSIQSCTLDNVNNCIDVPVSFTGFPIMFGGYDSSTEIWVTLADYWLQE